MAIDPICKMTVDEEFCAPGCQKTFDENPDKYIDK
jgi:YHS domain-containing protein